MTYDLRELTGVVITELYGVEVTPVFTRPEPQHGDYTTNVAMQLAAQLQKSPREIAEEIMQVLKTRGDFEISIAGPGFLNIRLSDAEIFAAALQATVLPKPHEGKVAVAEYSDPNPFKVLHAGHLYTSLVGDTVANLIETAGATVHRVNYGGDVGLHVGKTMYVLLQRLGGENPEKLADVPEQERSEWLASAYIEGTALYDTDEAAKQQIIAFNKQIYQVHSSNDQESGFAQIYWTCRQWSYDYFNAFYNRVNTPFEKYYPESQVAELGLKTVRDHVGDVFVESDGAVIFKGEDHGLHTRVFINSQGLPTYEAKEVGLIFKKYEDYSFDLSIIITGNEQLQYMSVVFKAIEQFAPELTAVSSHLTHGMVRLAGNVKMSSRFGNILRAEDIIDASFEAAKLVDGRDDPEVVLGAIRYSFLKSRIGGDIIYNPGDSISMEGNSGPYVQYALVRARSILRKAEAVTAATEVTTLDQHERSLARKIGMYPEAFLVALNDYSPHHICTYLYELAVTFNRFYEQSRVIDHERSAERVALTKAYEATLSHGLSVLGMPKPEQM